MLVALAEHAALALESAQEGRARTATAAALEQLLPVSSRLTETLSIDAVLDSICEGISDALGFAKVSSTCPTRRRAADAAAAVGWRIGARRERADDRRPGRAAAGSRVRDRGLLPADRDAALARLPERHVLRVGAQRRRPAGVDPPLAAGAAVGPKRRPERRDLGGRPDRPAAAARDVLQALRVFANQATAALDSATHFEEMRFLAEHDPLTRLLNRRAFTRRLAIETARSGRYHRPFALVLCDLDGFKQPNDRHGHEAGDAALARSAPAGRALRRSDPVFRIGGDEFALLLPETDERHRARGDRAHRSRPRLGGDVPKDCGRASASPCSPATATTPRRSSTPPTWPCTRRSGAASAALRRMTAGDKRSRVGLPTQSLVVDTSPAPARTARGHPAGAQRGGAAPAGRDRPDDGRLAGLRRRRHQPVPPGVGRLRATTVHGGEPRGRRCSATSAAGSVWSPILDERFARRRVRDPPRHLRLGGDGPRTSPTSRRGRRPRDVAPRGHADRAAAPLGRATCWGSWRCDEPAGGWHPDDDDSTSWWRSPPTPRWPSRAPRRAAAAPPPGRAGAAAAGVVPADRDVLDRRRSWSRCASASIAHWASRSLAIDLPDPDTGGSSPRAAVRLGSDDATVTSQMTPAELRPLMEQRVRGRGLLPAVARAGARARVDEHHWQYHSEMSGRGPARVDDHWLFVPLWTAPAT